MLELCDLFCVYFQLEDKLAKASAADKEKETLRAQLRDEEAKRMDLLAQLATATGGKIPAGDSKPVADSSSPVDAKSVTGGKLPVGGLSAAATKAKVSLYFVGI